MLAHAWPIVLVLVILFGGGFVRTIVKALFGGAAAAARDALAQLPTQFDESQLGSRVSFGSANAETLRAAIAAVADLQPEQTRAAFAEIVRSLEAPVPNPAKPQKPKRKKPEHAVVSTAAYARPGALVAALPARSALHRVAALAPLEPLPARRPLAPLPVAHT